MVPIVTRPTFLKPYRLDQWSNDQLKQSPCLQVFSTVTNVCGMDEPYHLIKISWLQRRWSPNGVIKGKACSTSHETCRHVCCVLCRFGYIIGLVNCVIVKFVNCYTYTWGLLLWFQGVIWLSQCKWINSSWPHFYQTRSAWSKDQGSNENHSPVHNFAPTVTKFCHVGGTSPPTGHKNW